MKERACYLRQRDLGMLGIFGREIEDCFGHLPFLVGSALRTKDYRDVDVRLILPDNEYLVWFGMGPQNPHCQSPRWNAFCLAFSSRGEYLTRLPIDFQIDQMTEANALYPDQRRIPIGMQMERVSVPPVTP